MIVIDSSILVQALIDNEVSGHVRDRLRDEWVAAPHLIDLESTNAVKHLERAGIVDTATAISIVDDLSQLPMTRYHHSPLLARCWELRHNLSIYDAAYVALAEALDAPLVTSDAAFARAPGIECTVELLSLD